jgi:hypothetical protein
MAREDSDVVGNVLYQGYTTRSHHPIRIGGDGTGQTWGRFRFLNNTIVLGNASTSAVFRTFDGIESVEMHNNVLHRLGGGPVTVFRDTEARWKGARSVTGKNNWVTSGSSAVPSTWTGTLTGSSPGFIDVAGRNLRLASTSPLRDKGTSSATSAAGLAFPNPLAAAAYEPPFHALAAPKTRSLSGSIDIGAYELGGTTTATPQPPPSTPTLPVVLPPSGTPSNSLAIADAYIESGSLANSNFGSLAQLYTQTNATASYGRETYLKFDVSSLGSVSSAKIRISAALTTSSGGAISMSVYPVTSSSWTESAITWNNKPLRNATALSSVSVATTGYVRHELDVTSFIKSERAAGRTVVSFALRNPSVTATSARILMQSRQSSSGQPELVVTP